MCMMDRGDIPRIIELSPEERAGIAWLARGRHELKRGLPRGVWGGWTSLETHTMGLTGEYAVAKALGIGVDISLSRRGDGHTWDLVLRDWRTIEVKYRAQRGWDFALWTDQIEEFVADVGVLCWPGVREDTVEIVGCISRQRFGKIATITDYGKGHRLAVGPEEMVPLGYMFGGKR